MPFLPLIWSMLSGAFSAVWSFVSRPPGTYIALALAALLAVWIYGRHEYDRGQADCQAAHAQAVQKLAQVQTKQIAVAVADSDKATTAHATEDATNKEKVRTIYLHDKALPDAPAVCVTADDADRLRALN